MTKATPFNPLIGITVEVELHSSVMDSYGDFATRLGNLARLDHPYVTRVMQSRTTDVNDNRAPIQREVITWGNFTIDMKIPLNDLLEWLEAAQPKPAKKKGGEA